MLEQDKMLTDGHCEGQERLEDKIWIIVIKVSKDIQKLILILTQVIKNRYIKAGKYNRLKRKHEYCAV